MRETGEPAAENVVLFPKTVEYYQIQLTMMLESERYGEAAELLRFLIGCQGQEPQRYEEWRSLLEWLEDAFPQATNGSRADGGIPVNDDNTGSPDGGDGEEEEAAEDELARRKAREKQSKDADYERRLLRQVTEGPPSEAALLALDQLAHLDSAEGNASLSGWLQGEAVHPILQFRALQTLRRRGAQGSLDVLRGGERVKLEIESVPLEGDEFPQPLLEVVERVAEQTETHEPALYYFAKELWEQFMMALYGTADYRAIIGEENGIHDIWAAALHQMVAEMLNGSRDEAETREQYGITGPMRFQFEQAFRTLKAFGKPGK